MPENSQLRTITRADFDAAVAKDPYYRRRWTYFEPVIEMINRIGPSSVLELGAHRLPLVAGSDVMGLPKRSPIKLTYAHRAEDVPWPIDSSAYDLFIALQVWEHLPGNRADAFREVRRIASRAILSFPYLWNCPRDPTHHGVTLEMICAWTAHHPPVELFTVKGTPGHTRLVGLWEF